jgi:hypothetical protein
MSTNGAHDQAPGNVADLTREIKQTRQALGDAVQQLAAKTDVKRLASEQAGQQADRLKAAAGRARSQLTGAAATAKGKLPDSAGQVSKAVADRSQQRTVAIAAAGVFAIVAAVLLYQWRSSR